MPKAMLPGVEMPPRPLTIGLVVDGGGGWWGRLEYTKNIAAALREHNARLPENAQMRVLAIATSVPAATVHDYLSPHVDGFVSAAGDGSSLRGKVARRLLRTAWKYRVPLTGKLDRAVRSHAIDFLYPSFQEVSPTTCRTAAWIPDFQHLYLPQLFTANELKMRERGFGTIAAQAPTVVVSSESSAGDFARTYPPFANKLAVLRFRISLPSETWDCDSAVTVQKYHLPTRYLIICNQFWHHKNHAIVFRALRLLKESGTVIPLVCTGRLHDHRCETFSDEVLSELHTSGIADQVKLLGLIPKADQIELLRGSVGLVQPSRFEGWNTAIEEAMALGIPVMASDIPVHREQCGALASYASTDDVASWARILEEAWKATGERHNIANRYTDLRRTFADQFIQIASGNPPVRTAPVA
jgi:glycosyltransferase involved in cell wall biosynthesis